jgi:tRNA/rRNA methyltransferase
VLLSNCNNDNLRVVLVGTRNPLNIGAAARAISNFGFRHLRLVNPYRVAADEARSGVNASAILEAAQEFATVPEAIGDCTLVVGTTAVGHRELQHPIARLEYAGKRLRTHLASQPAALLFGSEKFGLSNDDLSYCHWLLRIGTREEHASMNLGQAVAVCLYEISRRPAVTPPEGRRHAKSEDLDRITDLLNGLLRDSGYVHSASAESKTRRLVRRLRLQAHDAEVWLGMLRQIDWKLKSQS